MIDLSLSGLDQKIVNRKTSFFADDLNVASAQLADQIKGSRVLVIGGAGSIGFNTLRVVAHFKPATMHIIDHNENGLAEVVRSLRSSQDPIDIDDFLTLPFDYGGAPFRHWLASQSQGYDYVLNFAALKHVRSEKDPYSILAMLETNVLKLVQLAEQLENTPPKRLFCVSTDKAANPSSMMGATKRLMEHALFKPEMNWSESTTITSARFANVAMSNGSLLNSWMTRLELHQPLACPEGCRRFFVSLPESGHLCTLAAFTGENQNLLVPALAPAKHLVLLQDVAEWFLDAHGYTPHYTYDEVEARSTVEALAKQGKWPVLLTPLDTAGEKPYEEFFGTNEQLFDTSFASLQRVPYLKPETSESFEKLLDWLRTTMRDTTAPDITIDMLKSLISEVEPAFAESHRASQKSLDNRV